MATADSSLIVPLYLPEPNSALADAVCKSVATPIRISEWHRVEIANAFQRAIRHGRITEAQASVLWKEFMALPVIQCGKNQAGSISSLPQ
jgi:predicted nucleic acid-binding protein